MFAHLFNAIVGPAVVFGIPAASVLYIASRARAGR